MSAAVRALGNMFQSLNNYLQSGSRFSIVLVLLGLLIATIYVSPHIYRSHFLSQNDQIYFPLNPETYIDEVNVTGPRIRDVIDGKFLVSDVDTYEYKDASYFMPPLPPLLLAPISLLTGDVLQTIIISDFLFPGFFFFIFFWIGIQIFNNRYYSTFFAVFMTLFPNFGKFFPPLSFDSIKILIANLLPIQIVSWTDKLGLILRESYIPDFILFGPALLFLLLAAKRGRSLDYILTAIFFGLTFYTYPFHWIFLTVTIGLLGFLYLLDRNYQKVKNLTATVIGAFIIGASYFINYFNVKAEFHGQEIFDRVWIEKSHLFRISDWEHYVVLLTLGLIVFWLTKKKDRDIGKWLIALLAAGFVVLNMQVITGMNIAPIHWIPRTNTLAIDFALFYILYRFIIHMKDTRPPLFNLTTAGLVLCVTSLITGALHQQYVFAKKHAPSFTMEQSKIESLIWLDANMEMDEVVMVGDVASGLMIPLHTKGRLYVPRALNTYASDQEIAERFYITANVLGWETEDIETLFDCQESNLVDAGYLRCNGSIVYQLYGATYMGTHLDAYKDKTVNPKQKLPQSVYKTFVENYQPLSDAELADTLKKYRVDYLYLNHDLIHTPVDQGKLDKYFEELYANEDIKIYGLKTLN